MDDLKCCELLRYMVNILGVDPPGWYEKYRREANLWYSVFLCLVEKGNEDTANSLFEMWMQRSGFLRDSQREMSPRNLKSLRLDGLKCEYV